MEFGLMHAPLTFQRITDVVFRASPIVRVYVDDMVTFSPTMEEHLKNLKQVFTVIDRADLKLKLSRCSFAQFKVKLLSHIVGPGDIVSDPENSPVIKNAPSPKTTTENRSFLGLARCYRRFIWSFAESSSSLQAATSGKKPLKWTPQLNIAYTKLKEKRTDPPVLAYLNFECPIIVETDASSVAVGAVLAQKQIDRRIYSVQLASQTSNSAEKNYSAFEREALAVIFALRQLRVYLLCSKPCKLITVHQILSCAFRKKGIHGRLTRWLDFLSKHDFNVKYWRRAAIGAADYFLRIRVHSAVSSEGGELPMAISTRRTTSNRSRKQF